MSSTSTASQPTTLGPIHLPPPHRQVIYTLTGCLAGLTTVPIRSLLSPSAPVPILTPTLRAGARFYTFNLTRTNLSPSLPFPLSAAISGASGGISEVVLHCLVANRGLPGGRAVASHAGKLFVGFGTFTGLSRLTGSEMPPRPFWWCWALGAVAGGVAVGVVDLVEGGWRRRWKGVGRGAGVGAAVVGTAISVQVTSCREVLGWVEGR